MLICTCFIVAAWNCFFHITFIICYCTLKAVHLWRVCIHKRTSTLSIEQSHKTIFICSTLYFTSSNTFKFILILKNCIRGMWCNCFDLSEFWNSNFMHQPWFLKRDTHTHTHIYTLVSGILFFLSHEIFIFCSNFCFYIMHFMKRNMDKVILCNLDISLPSFETPNNC